MNTKQNRRRVMVFAAILLSLFSVVSAALPQSVAAAANESFIDNATLTQVKNHQKYYWLRNCFFTYDIKSINRDQIESWDFFEGSGKAYEIIGAVYGADAGATWGCAEAENVRTAFAAVGFDTAKPIETFCKLDGAEYGGISSSVRCNAGAGNADWDNKASRDALGKSFEKLAAASAPEVVRPINDVENYVRYYVSLQNQCDVQIQSGEYQEGSADDDDTYQIPVVNYDKKQIQYRLGIGIKSNGSQVAIVATKSGTPYTNGDGLNIGGQTPRGEVISCNEAANRLRSYAQAYQDFVNANEGKLTEATGTGGTTTPDETCESKGGSLSWLMCPVLALLDGGIFALTSAVESLLSVEYNKYSDGTVVQTWQVMRNIALLILVPMMLLMVIGTALEFGPFDAYTVKKALPRMVLAVMFITLSLPITQFLVNLSNVFGYGIQGLILTASNSPESLLQLYEAREGALFSSLVIAGIGVAGATGAITFGIILSLALVVFVTLLIGYVILVIRELLILVLIIVAPLAILVWIFPANDKLWKIWKTTFIALLMMFPIIILLITSGKVFAGLIAETQSPFTSFFLKIIALIAPFFFIPATFKYGLGVFGNLAGMINDRSRGLFDRQRKFREGSKANARARAKAGQRLAGGTSTNWRGRLNRGIGGGLNAPSAILSTGSLTKPSNWRNATVTQMSNNALTEVERNMKENPHYQSWMYNDDLNRAAAESSNEADLRTKLQAQGMSGQELEDSVNRVQAVRRTMDPHAFAIMTTRQAISGGTAYKTAGDHDDAGRVAAAIAVASGTDSAAMQYLIANGRKEGMSSGRVDYAGASFGDTLGVVETLRGKVMAGQDINAQDITAASKDLRTKVYENQGGAALVHSSMKPSAVKDMAPIMLEQVKASTGNDVQFAETLASMAAIYDGMAGSSPKRAKVISDEVLGQQIDMSSLSVRMQNAMAQYGVNPNGTLTVQKAIDVMRSNNNPEFLQMRREYGSLVNSIQAQQSAANQPGVNPGQLPPGVGGRP